jgi:hypothetical protein
MSASRGAIGRESDAWTAAQRLVVVLRRTSTGREQKYLQFPGDEMGAHDVGVSEPHDTPRRLRRVPSVRAADAKQAVDDGAAGADRVPNVCDTAITADEVFGNKRTGGP